MIFKGKDGGHPVLLLVSGSNRVDERALAARLGEAILRPDGDYMVTGFAIGGIPPFAHATTLAPHVDADLLQYETVWAAAGTPNAVFSVDPRQLAAVTNAVVMAMA